MCRDYAEKRKRESGSSSKLIVVVLWLVLFAIAWMVISMSPAAIDQAFNMKMSLDVESKE